MKTVSQTGGLTYDGATSVRREIVVIQNFPAFVGRVKSAKIRFGCRVGTLGTYNATIVLFKTFNNPGSWSDKGAYLYQTPSSANKYLTDESYCGNILARKSISLQFSSTGNDWAERTFEERELTDYGKIGANWAGSVMAAIYMSSYSPDLFWGNATNSTLSVNYNNGIVKYGLNGAWVDCEVYYGSNGSWVQVQPYYGSGGVWNEIGG